MARDSIRQPPRPELWVSRSMCRQVRIKVLQGRERLWLVCKLKRYTLGMSLCMSCRHVSLLVEPHRFNAEVAHRSNTQVADSH